MKKNQIMIVEDESIVAMDIERSLKRLGYEVPLIVSSGEEALENVERILPNLILMDIQLKGKMDGIETAGKIQKLYNIPVIFLTAYADEPTLQKAKEAEPYGYILKPFEEVELRTAIEVVLKKHSAFERIQNESAEKLNISEEVFGFFIDIVRDYAIYMLDNDGTIITWNEGAVRIEGYTADEVIGKKIDMIYDYRHREVNNGHEMLRNALNFGRYTEEGWRKRKDEQLFWSTTTVTAIYDKKGNQFGFGVVVHDLTKKKYEEEALQKAIVSRDEFLAIASHELRTPLTILKLQAEIFNEEMKRNYEGVPSKSKVEHLIDITIKQIQKLTFLVEDMLDISRIRVGKFSLHKEKFNLRELIQEVIDRNRQRFIQAKCGLPEFIYNDENNTGIWDKMRIEQVLTNVLNNALVYARGKPIKICLKNDEKGVQISIEDHGIGISQADTKKIFNRFERAIDANEVSGLGLGLYISSQIVEAHKGAMWVESELGKGSTFYVDLPMQTT